MSTPTLQSVIDWVETCAQQNHDASETCLRHAQEQAYLLVMETGQGWGSNQEEKAKRHLLNCARDGGRAQGYREAAEGLKVIARDLRLVQLALLVAPAASEEAAK